MFYDTWADRNHGYIQEVMCCKVNISEATLYTTIIVQQAKHVYIFVLGCRTFPSMVEKVHVLNWGIWNHAPYIQLLVALKEVSSFTHNSIHTTSIATHCLRFRKFSPPPALKWINRWRLEVIWSHPPDHPPHTKRDRLSERVHILTKMSKLHNIVHDQISKTQVLINNC